MSCIVSVLAVVLSIICIVCLAVKIFFPYVSHDLQMLYIVASSLRKIDEYKKKNFTYTDKLQENAKNLPGRKFLLFEEEEWTYKEFHLYVNRTTRVLRKLGLKPTDKIGVMMMNEPGFIATWFACSRLGATSAFLNFNLRAKSLLHCIDTADAKMLVVGKDAHLIKAIDEISSELKERDIKVYVYGPALENYESLTDMSDAEIDDEIPTSWYDDLDYKNPSCYIYTSGTTGLPKAVNITHNRCWKGAIIPVKGAKMTQDDVLYTSLPLYHAAAALIGVGSVMEAGCTLALRKKFSASQAIADCYKYKATILQYIGEIMRYIVAQPNSIHDRSHQIRMIIGNGMRPDVWRKFLDRFGENIHVMELYSATEGSFGCFNIDNDFASIGKNSPLLQMLGGPMIVKFDNETETMYRGENGRAVVAAVNEPGLFIGPLRPGLDMARYKGNDSMTQKKVLRDVFKKGDTWFNTGDLVVADEKYCLKFCDRVGDTFRWKGENVSTNEVGDILSQVNGISEANVYGVEIPGYEGRAGMASVILDAEVLDVVALYKHISVNLPPYARPLFIRVQKELLLTGTFKHKKVDLKKQGFDLDKVGGETVYFLNTKLKSYEVLSHETQRMITDGSIRL